MFRFLSPGDSISVALRKLPQGVRRVKRGYMEICNKGSRHSEYQRSGVKWRNLVFCVWEDVSFWAHWIHLRLSSLGKILCHCSPCFLHFPQLLSNLRDAVAALAGSQFGEPSFTFGGQKLLMVWHFLFLNMAWGIFISQQVLLCLILFVCFLRNSYAALCDISCFLIRHEVFSFHSRFSYA